MGDGDGAPERGGRLRDGEGVLERGGRRAGAGVGGGVGDDGGVSERGGGAGECAEPSPEPLRHLKHLVGMLFSSHSSTFFRYHSFSPVSRYMIASAPQFRQYSEMGGPQTEISEEVWGDMATSFDVVKRA